MLWFFEREGQRIQCEIRPSVESAGYELEWTEQGEVHLERSTDVSKLAERWLELEQRLKREGWKKLG